MFKQLNLFDYLAWKNTKKAIPSLSKKTRDVIHRELPKFFECSSVNASSDQEYHCDIELAYNRNKTLVEYLLRVYNPYTIGLGIIYFLAQLEDNKKIYVKKVGGIRTYTTTHLFDETRGAPHIFLEDLMKEVGKTRCLSKYSYIVEKLLLKSVGKDGGRKEKFLLSLLESIGVSENSPSLREYREEVAKGNFGHPTYINVGNVAKVLNGPLKERVKNSILNRIDSILLKTVA